MRIAQVAPLYESVPPQALRRHGASRLLPDRRAGAARARGHAVRQRRLADHGETRAACPRALWRDENCRETLPHHVRLMELVFEDVSRFDVIHFHSDYLHFPLLRRSPLSRASRRCTGGCTSPDLRPLVRGVRRGAAGLDLRRPAPAAPEANWQATVYHGLPRRSAHLPAAAGRVPGVSRPRSRPKTTRPRHRDRASGRNEAQGRRQDLSGGARLFSQVIEPLLRESQPWVEFIGEVGGREKDEFLGNASALLFPDRLAGAVRPGDDRGDGLRHAGHRLAQWLGARSHHRTASRASLSTASKKRCEPSARLPL